MSLARLLPQIEARKQHLAQVLPDFGTATRYVWPQTFILNRECYIFEYYLLQLAQIKPQYFSESSLIEKAATDVSRLLRQMYKVHCDLKECDVPLTGIIEQKLQKTASRFFVDAAENDDMELLNVALEYGADVNYQYCGESAIGLAAKHGHQEVVRQLAGLGANMDIVDGSIKQRTPLDYAAESKNTAMLALLYSLGASVRVAVDDEPEIVAAPKPERQDTVLIELSRKKIMALAVELERIIVDLRVQRDARVFGGAAAKKANNLSDALIRAQKQFVTFKSVDEFVEYSENGLPSIKTALGVSVKLFGRDQARQEAEALIARFRI